MRAPASTLTSWLWLLPVLAAILAYAPAFQGEFVWDDQNVWLNELPRFRTAVDVLRPPDGIPTWTYSYYRPVVVGTYLLDTAIGGPVSPRVPHVANVIYHAFTTGFVWLLLRRLLRGRPGAAGGVLAGALLFALHPIHAESVSWIAGRSDLLATMFLVPAVALALRGFDTRSVPALLLSPALFLFAVTAKESAVIGLVLVPMALLLAGAPPGRPTPAGEGPAPDGYPARQWFILGAGYLLVSAGYLWLRHWAGVEAGASQGFAAGEVGQRLLSAAGYYAGRVVVPWPQSAMVTWDMAPAATAAVAIVAVGLLVLAAGYRQWRRHGDGSLLFGAAWFWMALVVPLYSAVGPLSRTPLAERHLYLPSVGAAIVFAWVIQAAAVRGWQRRAGVAAALLLVLLAAATVQRGLVWQQDIALWSDTVRKAPERGMAWLNLGLSQWRRGDAGEARRSLERALETGAEPEVRTRSAALLGTILIREGDVDGAESYLRRAIAASPQNAEPYYGLARVYISRWRASPVAASDDAELAIRFLRRALERHPGYHAARLELAGFSADYADALLAAGEAAQARSWYDEAGRELDTLEALLPPPVRTPAYATLRREIGIDAAALRARLQEAPRTSP